MTCEACASVQSGRPGGRYDFRCVDCCARLVRSARPLKAAQLAMLAAIERTPGAPSRDLLLGAVKRIDATPSPPPGLGPSHTP